MGKRLLEQKTRIDPTRLYHPREALELLKELTAPNSTRASRRTST